MKTRNLIIIILVVIIVLLSTCSKKPQTIIETEEVEVFTVVHTIDTFYETIVTPPKTIKIHDTIHLYGNINTYVYEGSDSLIDYRVEVDSETYPTDVRLGWELNIPIIVEYQRDSVHTIRTLLPRSFMSAGLNLCGNDTYFGIVPNLNYQHKKGNTYSLGYDPINKIYMVGFKKKIRFRK